MFLGVSRKVVHRLGWVALILATAPVRVPWYIKASFAVFCLALLISTLMSQFMPALFYVVQLFRSVLLFVAVARLCGTTKQAAIALMLGLGVGLAYETLLAIQQYFRGDARPGGNLGHSNSLGLASEFVTFPALALLLGTRRVWPALVVFSGLLIALVGGSRATLGLFALGIILTFVASLCRKPSSRKFAFGSAAVFVLLVATPAMLSSVNKRSEQQLADSDVVRKNMKDAARMIIADHPLGVGANQYVNVANVGGYLQRAGVPWNFADRSAPVHDVYYLVAAETGIMGLVGFLGTMVTLIWLGFRRLRQHSGGETDELVPGLLVTTIIVSVHVSYEWVFMNFEIHYLFAIAAGMLVGVTSMSKLAPAKQPTRPLAHKYANI